MTIHNALASTARKVVRNQTRKAAPVVAKTLGKQAAPAVSKAVTSAPRRLARVKAPAGEVKGIVAMVRRWFKLLDRNAPTTAYLPLIDDKGLKMAFPERTLRSHADFKDWYGGVLRNIKKATHTVERLDVKPLGRGRYGVKLNVRWQAVPTQGKAIDMRFAQAWRVHDTKAGPRISEYLVAALAAAGR